MKYIDIITKELNKTDKEKAIESLEAKLKDATIDAKEQIGLTKADIERAELELERAKLNVKKKEEEYSKIIYGLHIYPSYKDIIHKQKEINEELILLKDLVECAEQTLTNCKKDLAINIANLKAFEAKK